MIVDCALYQDGRRCRRETQDPAEALAAARESPDPEDFVWVGMLDPSADEFERVAAAYELHPLAVEDALTTHQRPKLEEYEGSLFVVLRTSEYDKKDETVAVGDLMVFVGDSFVVTVRHGGGPRLAEVRAQLEKNPEVLAHGPAAVLYAIADAVVDRHLAVADELHEDLEDLEEQVFEPGADNLAARIYGFKRQVLKFRKAVMPLVRVTDGLAGTGPVVPFGDPTGAHFIPDPIRPFFRDVADHVHRAYEQVDSIDRLVADILDANQAQIGVRQNDDMRKISAWAALAAVPTMLAGIYGMNFDDMPELHQPWGYPAVLAVMALACWRLHRAFKRNGWL